MTPSELAFWLATHRRVLRLQPEIEAAILRAFAIIRDALSDAELARLIESGNFDVLFTEVLNDTLIDRAMIPVRQRIRRVADRAFQYAVADLPKGGTVDGVLAVSFDHLNPKVIEAIRTMETAAIDTLKVEIRDSVRAFVENGLRDGVNPTAIARQVKGIIGLAQNQERAVANFERMLRAGDSDVLTRALRDKRFDRTVRRLFEKGETPSESQIETMTAAYRRKFLSFNANVNAKSMTLDSYKVGQALSWQDAIDKGVIPDGSRLMQTWVHFDPQPDPRPVHQAMGDAHETVPFGTPFSNGQVIPGLGDYNCRCLAKYHVARG